MSSHQKQLTIASRGSKLALWQAEYVKSLLEGEGYRAEILVIKTTGDRVQDRFLHEIGGKGLFVREIEQALMEKQADLAVHSLKDLPARTQKPFVLAAVLKRHRPTDVIIWNTKSTAALDFVGEPMFTGTMAKQVKKLHFATGSLRRSALLKNANPLIEVTPIRGNVDTRIHKLTESNWDGLILAEASLERLGLLSSLKISTIDPTWFTPSAAQGALVIETIEGHEVYRTLAKLGCTETTRHVQIERLVLELMGGDCTMPFGCHVKTTSQGMTADAVILNTLGKAVRTNQHWPDPKGLSVKDCAEQVVEGLRQSGAETILRDLNIPSPFK